MKILVTGASGLIGRTLLRELQLAGHEVYALVRHPEKVTELDPSKVFRWIESSKPPVETIYDKDIVIHLAGEVVADKPWTDDRKKALRDSRLQTTTSLTKAIEQAPPEKRPKVFISASAIGIYGSHANQVFEEDSPAGSDFLANLCVDWESPTKLVTSLGVRLINMRLGLVLSKEGGFLSKAAPIVLGSGQQWMSWVHITDVVKFIKTAITDNRYEGPFNLVSPNPLTNHDLTKIYAKKMGFPITIKVPNFALRLALGEMSSAVLASQRVRPKKLLELNYNFEFSDFQSAIDDIYRKNGFLDNYHVVNQFVPLEKEKVFPFFSRAENLEIITPPWLNFMITQKSAESIEKNVIIDYKLKIHGIPLRWRTLISEWQPDRYFIDDQLKGPYTKWHHVHEFDSVPGGTLLRDEVTFQIPGYIVGKLLLLPWIRKDVQTIFSYRKQKIMELYREGKLG